MWLILVIFSFVCWVLRLLVIVIVSLLGRGQGCCCVMLPIADIQVPMIYMYILSSCLRLGIGWSLAWGPFRNFHLPCFYMVLLMLYYGFVPTLTCFWFLLYQDYQKSFCTLFSCAIMFFAPRDKIYIHTIPILSETLLWKWKNVFWFQFGSRSYEFFQFPI